MANPHRAGNARHVQPSRVASKGRVFRVAALAIASTLSESPSELRSRSDGSARSTRRFARTVSADCPDGGARLASRRCAQIILIDL